MWCFCPFYTTFFLEGQFLELGAYQTTILTIKIAWKSCYYIDIFQ